jgi:membrane-bound lytic murein transglycosylase D
MITPALFAWLAPTSVGRTFPTGIQLILPEGLCERLMVIMDSLNSEVMSEPHASIPLVNETEGLAHDGSETIYHRVVAGDVLGRIAERYGVTLNELRRWNEIKGDRIDVGDILTLHRSPALKSRDVKHQTSIKGAGGGYTWYTVRRGDSLYVIAKRHVGISAESLMRYNNIGPDIRPGQRIKIPTR